MRIAVYGGSFNPLHTGHLAVMRSLAGEFDKVLLVVSPQNPLKSASDLSDSDRRLDDARSAVERHREELDGIVEVCDVEFHLPRPNYTVRTLERLKAMYPEDRISLVIGADQIEDFRRWKEYERILGEFGVCVFPRKGYDLYGSCASLLLENSASIWKGE